MKVILTYMTLTKSSSKTYIETVYQQGWGSRFALALLSVDMGIYRNRNRNSQYNYYTHTVIRS
uniref:Uncharacterized protein n=1 Tax=Anguilla anguilla TaxID=7936 RepID=A0A0E9RDR6_ANGAN